MTPGFARRAITAATIACILAGCRREAPSPNTGSAAAASSATSIERALADGERWESIELGGVPMGYTHMTRTAVDEQGQRCLRIDSEMRLVMRRGADVTEVDVKLWSIETPEGRLLRFGANSPIGGGEAQGTVSDGTLRLTMSDGPRNDERQLPWSAADGGFFAIEQSLATQPMTAGQTRKLRVLQPITYDLADVELKAGTPSEIELPGGWKKLLPISSSTKLADGAVIEGTLWVDDQGQPLKSTVTPPGLVTFVTTREAALAAIDQVPLDLLTTTMVPVAQQLDDPHAKNEVRYRVQMQGTNPAQLFSNEPRQQVRELDAASAEIVARAQRLGDAVNQSTSARSDETTDDLKQYLAPSNFIQSTDPRVIELAQSAAPADAPLAAVALALERLVHERMQNKNYAQAFATAAEVARRLEGDCTEHAVLLAALARARGIPARIAAGLVYVPSARSFAYHMWTEVFIDGRWQGLDATQGAGGIGPAHLKLLDTDLSGATALSALLPVAQAMGRLQIEVLDVK